MCARIRQALFGLLVERQLFFGEVALAARMTTRLAELRTLSKPYRMRRDTRHPLPGSPLKLFWDCLFIYIALGTFAIIAFSPLYPFHSP